MSSGPRFFADNLHRARARLALACLLTLSGGSVGAAVFNVAAGDTPGLIAAINTANGNGAANVINLGRGTYNIASADNITALSGANGLPVVINTLTINGNDATISRTGVALFRVLQVGSDTGTTGALTLNNITINGGNPGQGFAGSQKPTDGGGIMVFAANSTLTVNASTITGNTSRGGAGISIEGTAASAVITNTTVSGNNATGTNGGGFGGGIGVEGFMSSLTVITSKIINNVAGTGSAAVGSAGGGISVDGGANVVTITNSTISGNQANGGTAGALGGGIAETGGNASTYLITGSTISNNSANATAGLAGGGAFVAEADATVTIRDSTISGNSLSTPNATAQGGAILNQTNSAAMFVLSNVTVTNNSAKSGGGLFQTGTGTITLRNSILAGNTASTAGSDCNGPIASQGHNLVGNTGGCTFSAGTGDLQDMPANLAPLADNGGPTLTHALNPGSVATDAGDPGVPGSGGTACEATDQRGVPRPLGPRCDIGAFEVPPGMTGRRVHGLAGTFDLPLSPIPTNPTTEPRQGPAHSIVFTFASPVSAASATVTEGIAVAGAPTFNGNEVTVGLTGVADQQYVTLTLTNINGTGGGASVRIGFLLGDVNQNRVVTVADLGLVNAQLTQVVTASNFLKDVNASGTLTVADKGITNANLTRNLPPP